MGSYKKAINEINDILPKSTILKKDQGIEKKIEDTMGYQMHCKVSNLRSKKGQYYEILERDIKVDDKLYLMVKETLRIQISTFYFDNYVDINNNNGNFFFRAK